MDTTNILGRGAVRELGKLMRALAAAIEWGKGRGYEGYLGSSVKGRGRHRLVGQGGAAGAAGWDCGRRGPALGAVAAGPGGVARTALSGRIVDAAQLLGQLLLQDIERKSGDGDGDDGVSLKAG